MLAFLILPSPLAPIDPPPGGVPDPPECGGVTECGEVRPECTGLPVLGLLGTVLLVGSPECTGLPVLGLLGTVLLVGSPEVILP